ncbi:DUF1285 domain-containing protein [Ruegeria sp. WL0004]|uniref:DUF1285 domain-containing protein n=1 Tax=Ruegeria marisflavi TaxID=2984152 RepID=A0ABT2WK89_9RHOB|nr:DUF1285 domain-containing protein [Ruegeria sp. WL0004]MCU9836314.1 DUF1285 domain-containing protein [Ruegeria sp. WL0004]
MSGQKPVKPSADSLAAAVRTVKPRGLPPVHLWNPPLTGEMDMRIARNGTWYHEGTPINRSNMVRLFSSILKLEDGQFFLVTPVEKVAITVDDAPFVAVDCDVTGDGRDQVLTFTTNVGDTTIAGPENRIRLERDPETGEPSPYVHVRAGLEALIDRKTFYRLVDQGTEHQGWFGVWSSGQFFPLAPADQL